MSDFVNYSKRSVVLPAGCKDLIDVLRQDRPNLEWLEKYLGIDLSRTIARGGMVKGTFLDIEKHVQRAATASALMFILNIIPNGERFTFRLHQLYQRPLEAIIELETGTPQAAALRRSLAARNLRTPDDVPVAGLLFSDLPWRLTLPIEPLPANTAALARVISELLRETNSLAPEPELAFHHHELVMVP
jgi:hypothetical protein